MSKSIKFKNGYFFSTSGIYDSVEKDYLNNILSSKLVKKIFYKAKEIGSNVLLLDTGLNVNAAWGGGAFLSVITWHLSTGNPVGTRIDVISCCYSGDTIAVKNICNINNNEKYSKGIEYSVNNSNLTIKLAAGGGCKVNIYKIS